MKGIVFTELIRMIEQQFGDETMDDVFDECELVSGGAYTSVGTYDYKEFLTLVGALSKHTGLSIADLTEAYGYFLFFRFQTFMPSFFENQSCVFDFLESVDGTIHVEVKKLYPDAQLPRFETRREAHDTFIMTYYSPCPFANFAQGLIKGCIAYFDEPIEISSTDQSSGDEYVRIFELKRRLQ